MVDFSRHVKLAEMSMNFEDKLERYYQLSQFYDRTIDTYEVLQYAQGERLDSIRYDYEGYTGTLY
jgi:hypothetical protein